jgi:hypothetical protein
MKNLSLRKVLVAMSAFGAVALGAGTAAADYPCSVEYYAGPSTVWGNEGSIYFAVYTGKNCTGTFVKSYALCSSGASSSSCAQNRSNDRATLLANFQVMRDAVASDQKVTMSTATCNGGAAGCATYAKFFAE